MPFGRGKPRGVGKPCRVFSGGGKMQGVARFHPFVRPKTERVKHLRLLGQDFGRAVKKQSKISFH
jgi:hypothetical protein